MSETQFLRSGCTAYRVILIMEHNFYIRASYLELGRHRLIPEASGYTAFAMSGGRVGRQKLK